jgi:hypothetical protein
LFFTVAFQNDETDEQAIQNLFRILNQQLLAITSNPPPSPAA